MSKKSEKVAGLVGRDGPEAYYLGYFDHFNRGLFYEAHDVLEQLWLPQRREPGGAFYKGLIQFAGAFVHLQKNRLRPAAALFKLARANIAPFAPERERLDAAGVVVMIDKWLAALEGGEFLVNPLSTLGPPRLQLRQK